MQVKTFSHNQMESIDRFIEKFVEEFNGSNPGFPSLLASWDSKGKGAHFSLNHSAGTLKMKAGSPHAAVFGMNTVSMGVKSGHLAEFLGKKEAKFPLRPLWLTGVQDFHHISEWQCQQIIQMGYNAVIIECSSDEWNDHDLKLLRSYGIQVIVKPAAEMMRLSVFQHTIPQVDGILWEASYDQISARDFLEKDLVFKEVKLLEEALMPGTKLLYYLPCENEVQASRQAEWIPWLMDEMGPDSILIFSAYSGKPTDDGLLPHPLWGALRASPDVSSTPLMPMINIGSVSMGEGFWPILPLDLIESYFERLHRHPFAGTITLVKSLPSEKALLSGNLWVNAQMLWGGTSPSQLMETWFCAMRPEFSYEKTWPIFQEIRQVSVEVNRLFARNDVDRIRCHAESILSRLRLVEQQCSENQALKDYASFFLCDAQRFVMALLQKRRMPAVNLLPQDDGMESFWTKNSQGEAFILDEPQRGEAGSLMGQIFQEIIPSC